MPAPGDALEGFEGVLLAPFWRRTVGVIVDQVVAMLPPFLVLLALGHRPPDLFKGTPGFWFNVAYVGLGLTHETIGVWRFGRSIGKWVCRTRVVRSTDLGPVAASSAFIRSLVPAAFGVVPGVGPLLGMSVYLWAFVDTRRQGIHDKAAATLVIR